jgi:flavin-dependent dehydrogenase
MNEAYDCIVIGGGPAGATTSTILADYGHRVMVLEKSRFPRHHIGESLMPQTYWTFKRIGMLDKLKKSDFTSKESVQFVSAKGQESQPYYFPDRDPNEWSFTWQVKRDRFDKMMLDNSREHGVEVREGVQVKEVLFEGSP